MGLDRAAVTDAVGELLSGGTASSAQIEFVTMVVEHLTDQGVLDPALLYDTPFTDVASTGPDRMFDEAKVTQLFARIEALNQSAVA